MSCFLTKDLAQEIENFLKIDVKENFMSRIDDEIALLQIHSKVSKSKKDVALVLKTNNIGDAEKNLNLILEQIRKRSPAKFKAINYKGHTIKFMSIKGFFKVVLGNLFKSIDKPYFTIIDDYVVFSNHPNTLKSIINTYTNRETLDTFEAFTSFNDEFNSRSSVFAYINTYSLYQSVYNFSNPETKNKLKKNKDFLICFPQIGIQLTAEDDFFDSKIRINYEDIKTLKNKYSFTDTQDLLQKQNTAKIIEITKNNVNSETVFNIPATFVLESMRPHSLPWL